MRHNHTFFMWTGRPRQDPLVVHFLVSTLSLGVGTCHVYKLASPPVLPRCVHIFHFSIFIYYACIILAFLRFANLVKNSVSQFRIHLLLHLYTILIRMQTLGFLQEHANAMMLATYRVSVKPRVSVIQSIQVDSTYLTICR